MIAWGICFDGYISVARKEVGLGVYDPVLIDQWWELVKHFGRRDPYKHKGDGLKWVVSAYREVLYVLVNIYPFLPTKRERARIVMERCARRIQEEDEGRA